MRYDWELRRARRRGEERPGRDDQRAPYGSTFHGYEMGYAGGALRSRGSFEAGQLRSGMNPRDEFEFRWGRGYVGGRGYGGTNYDLTHGYRVGGVPRYYRTRPSRPPSASPAPYPAASPAASPASSPAARGGYSWGEEMQELSELYGPARYGYGPYYERLRRRRRSDEEIRADVEDALFYDTWVDADRIEVEVEDGIVTLRGTLPNFDEVRFATDDAWDVDGVRGVRSEFKVGVDEGESGEMGDRGEEVGVAEPGAEGEAVRGESKSRRGKTQQSARSGRGGSTGSRKGSRSSAKGQTTEQAEGDEG